MWNSKHLLAGVGVAAIATALVSFSGGDEKEGKKKKYHVIHQKDGELVEFDTILPMSSDYTVDQFLADHNIDNEDVKIINVPHHGHAMMFNGEEGEQNVFVHRFDQDITIDKENGEQQEVKIIREKNDKGEMTVKKFVNGEEVELSEEEMERMKHHGPHHGMKMRMHMDEGSENVEMKVEMDKDGNMTVKKIVNGEEVEVSEEEMEQIKMRHENHGDEEHVRVMVIEDGDNADNVWHEKGGQKNVELKVEVDKDGNMTVQKFVDGEEVEVSEEEMEHIKMRHENMGDHQMIFIEDGEHMSGEDMEIHMEMMEGDLDSLMQEFEIEIEDIIEESGEEGEHRIIVKEIRMGDENSWTEEKGEMRKEVRMQHHMEVEGDEDFTLVLVTENIDEDAEVGTSVNMQRMEMNEPIAVYPNPNKGTFTIAFDQKEELKTSLKVVDTQGKVVYKEKLGQFSGSYKKELDLRKHGAGVYIVNVQQGNETSSLKVIVE